MHVFVHKQLKRERKVQLAGHRGWKERNRRDKNDEHGRLRKPLYGTSVWVWTVIKRKKKGSILNTWVGEC